MNFFDNNHLEKLKKLHASYLEVSKLERLKYIFNFSEEKFLKNLKRLNTVKYILIAEAPPWTVDNEPTYFYSKIETKLHETFWKSFFSISIPANMEIAYQKLADKQFLLVDSIPYALNYNPRIRYKEIYQELVLEYLTFQLSRINTSVVFDKNLKIAFAFRINGQVIIKAFNGKITIGNKIYSINASNIAADASNFPKQIGIKNIFEI